MAQPRPSLTLVLDINEQLDCEEFRLEVNRCFSYVGSTLVRNHAQPENIARFLVKMGTRSYWNSKDEGSDELWTSVMERWFFNELHKVANNLKLFNRRQREIGNPEIPFDFLEIDLQNGTCIVRLRLDSNSDIAPERSELLTLLRDIINAGTLGEGVTKVTMPDDASFNLQRKAGLAAKEQREEEIAAEKARQAEEAAAALREAEKEAEEAFLESPLLAASLNEETEKTNDAPDVDWDACFGFDEPDFAIDYTRWNVEYHDGASRIFDSAERSFIA